MRTEPKVGVVVVVEENDLVGVEVRVEEDEAEEVKEGSTSDAKAETLGFRDAEAAEVTEKHSEG